MMLKRYILLLSILLCGIVQAGGHKPTPKPTTPVSAPTNSMASAGQSQGQGQDQNASSAIGNVTVNPKARASVGDTSSSSTAQGGKASAVTGDSLSDSSVVTGPTLSTATNGGNKLETTNVDSGNVTYREAANVVQLSTMFAQACGFGMQVGASKTLGSAIFGIQTTPEFCRDMMMAVYEHAVGRVEAGCEIVQSTEEAQRIEKRLGHSLPTCAPSAPIAAVAPTGTYTRDQVDEIVRKVTAK